VPGKRAISTTDNIERAHLYGHFLGVHRERALIRPKGTKLEAIADSTKAPPPEKPEDGMDSPETPTSTDKPDNPPAAPQGGGEGKATPQETTGEPTETREAGDRTCS